MRLHIPALALSLVMLTASKPGQAQGSVDAWMRAVEQHAPGKVDAQVYVVGDWSRQTLTSILRDVTSRNSDGSLNALLKTGAQLHGDVGLRIQSRAKGPLDLSRGWSASMLALDGREEGAGQLSFHLDFARALLDAVKPRPADHEDIRKWYRTVAAQLEQIYNLADALPHLARARAIFADDPEMLLASGCVYETLSSSRVQAVAESIIASGARTSALPAAASSRSQAMGYYRRALAVNPSTLEAKVRLGRLLGIDGRHGDAANLLRNAVAEIKTDTALAYYGWLFLGDELQATRQFPAAVAAYQRAADLYPRAQSPRFAMVCLARRFRSRATGFDLMQQTLGAPTREDADDPWWRYYEGTGRKLPPLSSGAVRLARAERP